MPLDQIWQVAALVVCVGAFAVAGAQDSAAPLTPDEGQRCAVKLAQITEHPTHRHGTPQRVTLIEREVNAYLRFQGAASIDPSVREPTIGIDGAGKLSGHAIVDLDAVRRSQERGLFDPLRYLSGDLRVSADGVLTTANGVGQIEIGSVTVGSLPVPVSVLHELVRYYSRSDTHPEGVDLAEPFDLPYGIQEVLVEMGQAVVVQ